jgi:hypothetical protein
MFSVHDGFVNRVHPKTLSHPANCELITKEDNYKKGKNSSITLEQLLKRIEEW